MNDYHPTSHSPAESDPVTTAVQERRPSARGLLSKKKGAWIVAAGLTCAVAGLAGVGTSAAAASSSSASSPSATATTSPTPTPSLPGGGPRSGPAEGGTTGIVDATSTTGFTVSTATGVEVNITETSATKTRGGPARAVKKGASVLVLGVVDAVLGGTNTATIAAAQVIVQPHGDGGAAASKRAGVVAAQQGVPSPVKSVGQIPSDYTEGDGTIVSGATADKVTTKAQALVPGGIVDRVVLLSDGEYEVHNISIAWPHHVFVSKNFKVVGAF
jgi:hypothetical protein